MPGNEQLLYTPEGMTTALQDLDQAASLELTMLMMEKPLGTDTEFPSAQEAQLGLIVAEILLLQYQAMNLVESRDPQKKAIGLNWYWQITQLNQAILRDAGVLDFSTGAPVKRRNFNPEWLQHLAPQSLGQVSQPQV